ncbi:RHOMBOID-like protein 2 isoform X2 [Typha latifolia]|uniref:RHOMBOID-like protein 2 isoform X2 n=1 Tax=Typha latifolia TaxID=4733 RepID=UPI003C2DB358
MRRQSSGEVQIKIPKRGDNSVHPLEVTQPGLPSPPPLRGDPPARIRRPFRRWSPWLVPIFVVANVVLFIVTMYINNCPKNSVKSCAARFLGRFAFQPTKENPLLGPSSATLVKMGALDVNRVVKGHQGWRLMSCIWLHAGVVHILANMLSLLVIGIQLEQEFGFVKIGLLYVISGLGGSLLSALFIQSSISVGASGAVFGLLGAMLSELIINWTIYANKCAALVTLVFIVVVNLALGLLPHVDNFAHIGGFVSGFLLGFVFLVRPHFGYVSQKHAPTGYHRGPVRQKHKIYQYILLILAAIILTVGFTVGLVMLFRGVNGNDHCSWCHYLSCIPTKKWNCNSSPTYCESFIAGNTVNLTCGGNGKSQSYFLPNASDAQITELCSQQCS